MPAPSKMGLLTELQSISPTLKAAIRHTKRKAVIAKLASLPRAPSVRKTSPATGEDGEARKGTLLSEAEGFSPIPEGAGKSVRI